MTGISNNRRVQYTVSQFKAALLQILATKSLDEVTVTEICRQADLNRGTFYLHFASPLALFEQIETDLLNEIQPYLSVKIDDMIKMLVPILKVITQHPQAATIILANPDSTVLDKIVRPIQTQTQARYQAWYREADPKQLAYYYAFFVQGAEGVLTMWLKQGMKESPEQIAKVIENVVTKGAPH